MPLPKPTPSPKAPKKAPEAISQSREIKHPEVTTDLCIGDNALTAEQMKEILGWEVEDEGKKFGTDYFTTNLAGYKVRAHNNVTNRPVYDTNVRALKQEVLMRRWLFNAEPFIVGKTGLVLNGQHTGTALILAQEELDSGKDKDHWKEIWPDGIVKIDKLVVYGVEEDDRVVNTMDTCKPRTLADVIYRSEFFAKMKSHERRIASHMCEHAIKFLWERTGAMLDPYSPKRTHAESLDFIARHPSLLKAVKHIMEENKGGEEGGEKIKVWLTPGYAAGLMYLQGMSAGEGTAYHNGTPPSEKLADKSHWEKAETFWVMLASGSPEFQGLRNALSGLHDPETAIGGTREERVAVIVKAWNEWINDGALVEKNLALEYKATSAGGKKIAVIPQLGGIDLGKSVAQDPEEPTPEELEAAKEQARMDKEAKKTAKEKEKEEKKLAKQAAKEQALRDAQGTPEPAQPPTKAPVKQPSKPSPAPAKADPKKPAPPTKNPSKPVKAGLRGGTGK